MVFGGLSKFSDIPAEPAESKIGLFYFGLDCDWWLDLDLDMGLVNFGPRIWSWAVTIFLYVRYLIREDRNAMSASVLLYSRLVVGLCNMYNMIANLRNIVGSV